MAVHGTDLISGRGVRHCYYVCKILQLLADLCLFAVIWRYYFILLQLKQLSEGSLLQFKPNDVSCMSLYVLSVDPDTRCKTNSCTDDHCDLIIHFCLFLSSEWMLVNKKSVGVNFSHLRYCTAESGWRVNVAMCELTEPHACDCRRAEQILVLRASTWFLWDARLWLPSTAVHERADKRWLGVWLGLWLDRPTACEFGLFAHGIRNECRAPSWPDIPEILKLS